MLADTGDDLVEQLAAGQPRPDPVVGAGPALLRAVHDPGCEVAYVDHLDRVRRRTGREHFAAVGDPVRPVAEPAGRVARPDDQPGADDHGRRRTGLDELLARDLHRAVGLRARGRILVRRQRIADSQRRGRPTGGPVVGIDVDRRHEHPVCVRERGHRLAYPGGGAGHVDHGVPVARQLGSVRRAHGRRSGALRPRVAEPDSPRQAQVTSWPRRTASSATARERKTVPPRTRSLMAASQPGADRAIGARAVRYQANAAGPDGVASRSRLGEQVE